MLHPNGSVSPPFLFLEISPSSIMEYMEIVTRLIPVGTNRFQHIVVRRVVTDMVCGTMLNNYLQNLTRNDYKI